MDPLTVEQRARILEAFSAMDPYAWSTPHEPDWESFYYDGYITLQGLLSLATVIAEMHLDGEPSAC